MNPGRDAAFGYRKGNTVRSPTAPLPAGFLLKLIQIQCCEVTVELGPLSTQSSATLSGLVHASGHLHGGRGFRRMQLLGLEDHTEIQACDRIEEVTPAYLLKNREKIIWQ